MTGAIARAVADADVALERLQAQVAALLAPARPRSMRSERILRTRSRRSLDVLYVDDDPHAHAFASALRAALPEGYTVHAVRDADEAVRLARAGAWSVAVLDLHLGHPRVTGLDVRDALPDATRVVFVSGYMRSDLPTISRCADVDEYLTKPFPPDELARVVVRLTAAPEAVTP